VDAAERRLECRPLRAVNARVVFEQGLDTPLSQHGSSQALGDEERVIVKRGEQLAERAGRLRLPRHAIDLGLELSGGDRLLPKR
jgi:hypothetical protein